MCVSHPRIFTPLWCQLPLSSDIPSSHNHEKYVQSALYTTSVFMTLRFFYFTTPEIHRMKFLLPVKHKEGKPKKRYFILNHLIPNLLTFHYRYVSSSSFFSTINHDVAYQPNKQIPPRHDLRLKTTKKALQKTACLEVSLWAESTANSTLKNTTRISTVSSLSSQILFFAVSPWLPRWIRVKSLHVCELELNFDIY